MAEITDAEGDICINPMPHAQDGYWGRGRMKAGPNPINSGEGGTGELGGV